MITKLAVSGYRSIRDLSVSLGDLNVVTGANGSGKSNLYRALRLLVSAARGGLHEALAREGGFPSTLWAGPEQFSKSMKAGTTPVQGTRRKGRVALKLGFAGPDYGYAIDLGLPTSGGSAFSQDAEIKREVMWTGEVMRPGTIIADRRGPSVKVRDIEGQWRLAYEQLATFDTMMTHAADPKTMPELLILREAMRRWRFYDHFPVELDAPARHRQIGTHAPVLSADGANLAAALQTIYEIGDGGALDTAVDDAFPGTEIGIDVEDGYFEARLHQKGLLRPLRMRELSDGTLRYLLLVAALLSPRPPGILVLNEPESSLHTDLLMPLGRLIVQASYNSQIIVVTHAHELVSAIDGERDITYIALEKQLGETCVEDEGLHARWNWPAR